MVAITTETTSVVEMIHHHHHQVAVAVAVPARHRHQNHHPPIVVTHIIKRGGGEGKGVGGKEGVIDLLLVALYPGIYVSSLQRRLKLHKTIAAV